MKFHGSICFFSVLACAQAMTAEEKKRSKQVEAVCSVSSLDFGPPLAKTGTRIDHLTLDCDAHNTPKCVVDILSVVEMVSWIASYMTTQIQTCTGIEHQTIKCTSSITGLISSTIAAAATSGKIATSCPEAASHQPVPASMKKMNVAGCVIDTWQAAWFLAKVGILINSAIITCGEDGDQSKCAANINGVVMTFVAAAHFVTAAVNDCSANFDYGVACAANTLKLTAVVHAIGLAAVGIADFCTDNIDNNRRLSNSTEASSFQHLGVDELAVLATLNITEDEMRANPGRVISALVKQQMKKDISAADIVV